MKNSIRSIFEPIDRSMGFSRAQRKEIRKRTRRMPASTWRSVGMVPLIILASFVWFGVCVPLVIRAIPLKFALAQPGAITTVMVLIFSVTSIAMAGFCMLIFRWEARPRLLRALQGMGYELCGVCGHQLRGLSDEQPRCPECGAQRARAVCPHCQRETPFRSGAGRSCPHCLSEFEAPVRPPANMKPNRLYVDPRLLKHIGPLARRQLREKIRHGLSTRRRLALIVLYTWAVGMIAAGTVVLIFALSGHFDHLLVQPHGETLAVTVPIVLLLLGAASLIVARIGRAPTTRRLLCEEGHEVCLSCGYWLDLEPAELGECPKCHAPREAGPHRTRRDIGREQPAAGRSSV